MRGKKTLLVEFDLSNPTLMEKIGLDRGSGVSDYLHGEAQPDDIIQESTVNKYLYILSVGKPSANPLDLIMSGKTNQLLNELEKSFDYIIV